MYDDKPAQFPGIALESEIEVPGSVVTILLESVEQDVQGAAENAGYTNTLTNESPSSVDNIVVIDLTSDDNKDDVIVQECKLEEGSPDDVADTSTSDVVQRDDVGDITMEDNPLPEDPVPEGMGSYANVDGQRRSTCVAQVDK